MKLSKRLGRSITYSNVVATMALFIALGGVSYAAVKLPKNSVGTKQIKKNAVTGVKIKKGTLTGDKLKNATITGKAVKDGGLSGSDINLATLGTVPVAATASDTLITTKRADVSASDNDVPTARAAATEIPLGGHGQISLYGKCFFDVDDDDLYAEIYARTSADGALGSFYDGSSYVFEFNTGTAEANRLVSSGNTSSANSLGYDYSYDASWASGPDGNGLMFSTVVLMRNGNPPAGASAVFTSDKSCIFTLRGTKFAS
jgi:hypothetical protein